MLHNTRRHQSSGPGRQTDARINNRWQTLRHFAAFINNILRLLPVGRQSGRSRLGPNSTRPGASRQMHAVRGNTGPRLSLLRVQQGPGLGALFLRWVGAGPGRIPRRHRRGVWSTWAVLIDSAHPLFKQSDSRGASLHVHPISIGLWDRGCARETNERSMINGSISNPDC